MKINWKRVVIGAIWAELLLMAIYFPAKMYSVPAFPAIAILAMVGSMFLGGMWIARKVESRFLLHGALVGIIANVIFYALFFSLRSVIWTDTPPGSMANHVFGSALKMFGAVVGGYVGGRLTKKAAA